MELKIIHQTKTELELEIINENETILNPITHKLSEIEDVDYASYITEHPLSNTRRLYIRVKKGDPKKILQQVIKDLHDEHTKFDKDIFGTKSKK